jgi:cytochrome c biogenesis protein CcmG/thiol:disulfide interchange protein DsbE
VSQQAWNIVLVSVALFGALFIVNTRVQSATQVNAQQQVIVPASDPKPLPNHPAPDFVLQSLTGETVRLADLRGEVVLVNIWASWCGPCRAEMPMIEAVHQRYAEQGLRVLAVNQAEQPQVVQQFLQKHGLSFGALLDRDSAVSYQYHARALPASFFIDRNGIIRTVYYGQLSNSVLNGTLEQLLAEGAR